MLIDIAGGDAVISMLTLRNVANKLLSSYFIIENIMLLTLTNTDKKAIIDDKNYDKVKKFKWYWKKSEKNLYYVATNVRVNGKSTTLYLHRFLLQPSPNKDVHHVDGNTLNNLEENLSVQDAIAHRNWHNRNRRFKDVTKPLCQ